MLYTNTDRVSCNFCSESRGKHILTTQKGFEDSQVKAEGVKAYWKLLWQQRIDDKAHAEAMADQYFPLLAVELSIVISATRDFKELNLKAILHSHNILNTEQFVSPNPSVGGWTKFAKTILNKQTSTHHSDFKKKPEYPRKNLQLKKAVRGWLNQSVTVGFKRIPCLFAYLFLYMEFWSCVCFE